MRWIEDSSYDFCEWRQSHKFFSCCPSCLHTQSATASLALTGHTNYQMSSARTYGSQNEPWAISSTLRLVEAKSMKCEPPRATTAGRMHNRSLLKVADYAMADVAKKLYCRPRKYPDPLCWRRVTSFTMQAARVTRSRCDRQKDACRLQAHLGCLARKYF